MNECLDVDLQRRNLTTETSDSQRMCSRYANVPAAGHQCFYLHVRWILGPTSMKCQQEPHEGLLLQFQPQLFWQFQGETTWT